jgi:hypothetical protein
MPTLPLAIEIADLVITAKERRQSSLDVKYTAEQLVLSHPEAEVSPGDVADVLEEESLAVGIVPVSEPD